MVCQGRLVERLGQTSDARFVGFPKRIGLDERVQDGEQFSQGGGEGDFLGFPVRQQTLIKSFDLGIEPRRGKKGDGERKGTQLFD